MRFLKALATLRSKAYKEQTSFDFMDYLPAIMLVVSGIVFVVIGTIMPRDSSQVVCFVGGAFLIATAMYAAIYPVPPDHGNP